jgi:hypothetical protein
VAVSDIEREISSIISDREKRKTSKVTADIPHDEQIASVATFFTPQIAISTSWKIYPESDSIAYIEASWRKIQDPEDGMVGYV